MPLCWMFEGRARCMRWLGLWLALWCVLTATLAAPTAPLQLNADEQAWLVAQRGKIFTVGFDPYAGLDSFEFRGKRIGLLPELLKDMEAQLGLHVVPAQVAGWDDAYQRFVGGQINILYGANPTPEREQIMRFTRPVWKYPYTVFARKNSSVQTLGDLDGKQVGFLRNDFVIQQLPLEFPNIRPRSVEFDEPAQALEALEAGKVEGFVTTGGGVEYEFLYAHPQLTLVAELKAITSDMTMAVAKDQALLAGILDKYIAQREPVIRELVRSAERLYNRKIFRLTEAELNWLDNKGEAVVGVAEDYLPFDYYHQGEYRGIAGEMLKRVTDSLGIRLKVVSGSFADIMTQARAGKIDVVNMAKTDDRLKDFLFPHPINNERDIIVGLKTSPPVQDVYDLEGQRVAVIDGFWHEEYLRKNLKNPQIVKTADILESLQLLRDGKVAYMIENPTVVEFYINGLGYTDVVKRGNTSKDSFVYFGVGRHQPELASIMDKVIPLIRYEEVKYVAIQGVPGLRNAANMQLLKLVGVLVGGAGGDWPGGGARGAQAGGAKGPHAVFDGARAFSVHRYAHRFSQPQLLQPQGGQDPAGRLPASGSGGRPEQPQARERRLWPCGGGCLAGDVCRAGARAMAAGRLLPHWWRRVLDHRGAHHGGAGAGRPGSFQTALPERQPCAARGRQHPAQCGHGLRAAG